MLRIRDLDAGYGLSQVLAGIDLEVPDGKLVAILGRNGMGKTTLCRSIMSLQPPEVRRGSIDYDGTELTRLPPHAVAQAGVGYIPQGRHVFGSLTVVENLTVAARRNGDGDGPTWDLDRVWEMFPRLEERRSNRAEQLSGGEQQMLAIARALTTNPSLLIMDEPSEGLAPILIESVGEQLRQLKGASLSMLLVEQNYSLAIALADLVYVLEKGEVVFRGQPGELDGDEEVKRRYLG
ncbi:MAG TPA: ABC transporter ATP-binding protein, partial [Candidatus Binatia bacterium]|nr:ABC transporter ATP-binding protein [Candidatus Binatia bacterium]